MNIGISVDAPYFPEINDERSKYKSRLTPILMELRRKHVVAAAASAGPQLSDDSWSGEDIMEYSRLPVLESVDVMEHESGEIKESGFLHDVPNPLVIVGCRVGMVGMTAGEKFPC